MYYRHLSAEMRVDNDDNQYLQYIDIYLSIIKFLFKIALLIVIIRVQLLMQMTTTKKNIKKKANYKK